MVKELKVHPIAARFPMMSDEELADLAASIKANGQRFPIIVDGDVLIDGRNRLAACKLAGVEPTFEELDGRDPIALIADVNLSRRNLTKGQHAMGYAMLYPTGVKGKRDVRKPNNFSKVRLSEARAVLAFSSELAASVFAGVTPLDQALQTVETERRKAQGDAARLDRLRKGAPDLAELFAEKRMTLEEATAAFNERESQRLAIYRSGASSRERLLMQVLGLVSAIIAGNEARIEDEEPLIVNREEIRQLKEAVTLLEKRCGEAT